MISYEKRIIENIVQHLPSGVMYINREGTVLLVNPVMEQITGISAGELVGSPADAFIKRINLSGFDYRDVIKNAVVKKRVNGIGTLADGRDIHIGFTMAPIVDTHGRVEGVIAIFAELTQVKRMEEEQRRMIHMALIGEMAARLAHEIKNPLASIIIGIQLQKKRTADPTDNQNLDMIISEIQRIDDLIRTMLTYSKTSVPHMTSVNVPDLIKNALNIMFPRLMHYNIKVEQSIPEDAGLEITADESALYQVFINIINNAIDAMTKGGTLSIGAGTVCLPAPHKGAAAGTGGCPDQELVKIDIRDSGPGIDSGDIDRIFSPFFSTKAQGVGLGLSIVMNVIDENMGRLTVDSVKGRGTVFSLYFLKGTRQKCYEAVNCSTDERERCRPYVIGDVYRCFRYMDPAVGCCGRMCTDCSVYRNGIVVL